MLPQYYRVHEGNGDLGGRKTRVDFSGGIEFDTYGRPNNERPILFVRFHGPDNDVFVRQPLTVGALLETTAVWSEARTWVDVCDALPPDEQAVERALIISDLNKLAFDPGLTLYTAPVRMLEHFANVSDTLVAYEAAAKLSLICLNLCETQFGDLVLPDRMGVWGERNNASKKNMDPAFAYAAILLNAAELRTDQSVVDWLENGLKRSGLPDFASILSLALARMKIDNDVAPSRWSEAGQYLLLAGEELAAMRAKTLDPAVTLSLSRDYALPLPPLIDANLQTVRLSSSSFDYTKYSPTKMYDVEWELDKATRNLLSACR
ncbi:hypothetical protein [Rhizobium etli]|uniref:Uncharacterized protein n=1 Tax=Rhizobium etli TaxID=29449 RepID=A0A7W6YA92_RHIET|nr:hypothetical protein [Rhizobium etli]MBB4483446.1 hypothetical protein [Rhizobium etli]MBB4539269.1 hypothetical protein [Rhizobium etli]